MNPFNDVFRDKGDPGRPPTPDSPWNHEGAEMEGTAGSRVPLANGISEKKPKCRERLVESLPKEKPVSVLSRYGN